MKRLWPAQAVPVTYLLRRRQNGDSVGGVKLFFVREGLQCGDSVELGENDSRHALKVLRLRDGDEITASDGVRQLMRCAVSRAGKRCSLRVLAVEGLEDRRVLNLAIAAIDADRLSEAISAAAQVGARRVFIVSCERSGRARLPASRLDRVAIESAKQIGIPFAPSIRHITGVRALAAESRNFESYLLDPDATRTLIAAFKTPRGAGALLIIGPAGDFTDGEKRQMRDAGAQSVRIGEAVVRAETAATIALGIADTQLWSARAG